MATFETNSWVWIPDPDECILLAKVKSPFKCGEHGKVQTQDGEIIDLNSKLSESVQFAHPEVLDTSIDNLISLNELHENALLHVLRSRFKNDVIYTYVSSILISVNPFKMLPLYTPQMMEKYRQGGRNNPPHVFAIADNAYRNLLVDGKSQSIVISGESGAGKSEATKLMLQYIADVSSRASGTSLTQRDTLEQQLLQANPIMEAFGNAKTVRNNNSSRFGKLISIRFNRNGVINGGCIINYLLEKSRVVRQALNERNYHIFYQLLAAAEVNPQLKADLHLSEPESYHYLNQSGVIQIEGVNDEKDFEDVQSAMNALNFSSGNQLGIIRIVAALLHLGNVQFEVVQTLMREDSSRIGNRETFDIVCDLLELDSFALEKSLTSKNIGTRSIIMVSYNIDQASDVRDAIVKRIYSNLFEWLIRNINNCLDSSGGQFFSSSIIGVLDIFGFESFEDNSFEQLCINYCNEKLQFHFNEHIFRLEQEVYEAEGVIVPRTDFKDNMPTVELLEHKSFGIFAMIDEEINIPRGSDETYLSKLLQRHKDHPNFSKPRPGQTKDITRCFGIRHYAGEVFYEITGFLEKNKDTLLPDIINVLSQSQSQFMRALFGNNESSTNDKSRGTSRSKAQPTVTKAKTKTLGVQFKDQLQELMETLHKTFPHFVRCMKPNHLKKGSIFESQMMLAQLRYAGLLEVCRIRKLGFPIRKENDEFFKRYKCICPISTNIQKLLENMEKQNFLTFNQWAKGYTKIFLRNKQASDLEVFREQALRNVAIQIQKMIRGFVIRCRYKYFRKILQSIKSAIEKRDENELNTWLDMSAELPFGGAHFPLIRNARILQRRLVEEKRVVAILCDALASKNLNSLKAAIVAVNDLDPPFSSPQVDEVKKIIQRIQAQQQFRDDLKVAIQQRDKNLLQNLLTQAEEMEMVDCEELRQATTLRLRLQEEEKAIIGLRNAIEIKNVGQLNAFISKIAELGIEIPEIQQAYSLQKQLMDQMQARQRVQEAIKERNLIALIAALSCAENFGLDSSYPEIQTAKKLKEQLECEDHAVKEILKATELRELESIENAISFAQKIGIQDRTELQDAIIVRDTILAERAAIRDLIEAVKSNTIQQLSIALQEALRLGLKGPEVEAARLTSQKLGAQSEAQKKLINAMQTDNIKEIEEAILAAKLAGVGECNEALECYAYRDRLKEQLQLIESLHTATAGDNLQSVSRAIANCMKMGISNKFSSDISAAKAKASFLSEIMKIEITLQMAIKSRNLDSLDGILSQAISLGMSNDQVLHAQQLKQKLQEEQEIVNLLKIAIEKKDLQLLEKSIIQAQKHGLEHENLNQAKVLFDREKYILEVRKILIEASEDEDLASLNNALESVIELGMSGDDVERAKILVKKLAIYEDAKVEVSTTVNTLIMKSQSKSGIIKQDLDHLIKTISQAIKTGVSIGVPEMVQANELKEKMLRQLKCQATINNALENPNPNRQELKEALDQAEDLELNLDTMLKVKSLLKVLDTEFRMQQLTAEEDEFQDVDKLKEEKKQRQARAENAKFRFINYPSLRTPDEFAKGVILNKKRVKDGMLSWQNIMIPRSLTELNDEDNQLSVHLFKSLLGYMGEKQMSFPASLAQDILQQGLNNVNIRDEIYLQIIKQLSHNKIPESIAKGWQIMCMCISTFPPSVNFENYLLNFIIEKTKNKGAVKNYAEYCFRALEGILLSGASGFVPTIEEIQSYKERPPILVTIELVDGMILTEQLPVTPDVNVNKVVEICSHFLQIRDVRVDTFGIFVVDLPNDNFENQPTNSSFHAPQPLRKDDYLGDIVVQKARQHQKFKFVFKRKIFLQNQNEISDDPIFNHLMFIQAEDETLITSNLRFNDEGIVTRLAAISMTIALGDDFPSNISGLIAADLLEFIPPNWRDTYRVETWAEKILKHRNELLKWEVNDLECEFVSIVADHPIFGGHFFFLHLANNQSNSSAILKLPQDVVICFNCAGMHILDLNYNFLASFSYADIYRWAGSSTQFSLVVWSQENEKTAELIFQTTQAAGMAAIILDYIDSIMESLNSKK